MMRVAVDAMGGDHAPAVEIEGAVAAAREYGIAITLVGDTGRISAELARHNTRGLDITIKNATEVIDAGADMVAVVSDLFNAMDIGRRAEEFQHLYARK